MATGKIFISERLYQLIEQYRGYPNCLNALRFWAEHSNMHLDKKATLGIFCDNKLNAELVLKRLVEDGVIRACPENNGSLYSLAEDGLVRSLASELMSFDWSQWQQITRKITHDITSSIFKTDPMCMATSTSVS
jgi:hypothetical protein